MKLLVANRGEVAVRVLRAAGDLGIATVATASQDDAASLHLRLADETHMLSGAGPAAYLDAEALVAAAQEAGCDALHPGYGLLSESFELAQACEEAGITWVGPRSETLRALGDKTTARALAERCGLPVLAGTGGATRLEEAQAFLASLAEGEKVMIKALAGGGGRGMRPAESSDALEAAWARCASEAGAAFGNDALYVERLVPAARHIEIQIIGDGQGGIAQLGERECSLQRRHQKLIEIAPSPTLSEELRVQLAEAAVRMAREVGYRSLGTFEYLLDAEDGSEGSWAFIEANARLQVEHTVTEEVIGVDLVAAQLRIAGGATLGDLRLRQEEVPAPRGFALQARINLETLAEDGSVRPSGGVLAVYEPPAGPGIRVDGYGYAGYATNPRFDSLLAKLVAHSPSGDFEAVVARALRGLGEFRIEGTRTNLPLLRSLLAHPDVRANRVTTGFVEAKIPELLAAMPAVVSSQQTADAGHAGIRLESNDPLAVLEHGKGVPVAASQTSAGPAPPLPPAVGPPGTEPVPAPLQGTIVSLAIGVGDAIARDQPLLVMEAMKMEHVIAADRSGFVRAVAVAPGDTVLEGHPLLFLEEAEVDREAGEEQETIDLDHVRPDLAEIQERHALGLDPARPEAVARRRKTGQRTARENVEDLCDPGSFIEYGAVVIAAQRRRRSLDDLIRRTPADGLVAGIGSVNGDHFGEQASRCAALSYDYTVLAGTQGLQNHRKKDRMFELAENLRIPLVFLTEGGGGRPGDTDGVGVAGLDCMAFHFIARLSGLVPLVGITSGRCFAGNAALLGCCDVVIATEGSNIGMGGPAMIEGGGLGVFRPEEVGPMSDHVPSGVVDIPVADEAEAVQVAKQYLSYFQGPLAEWECVDQRLLRSAIPENRLRIYDVRKVIESVADTGSVLELRRGFGAGMVTALARMEGRPLGIIANNPTHLAGAIDSDGADKAARFMQLCDGFDLPILFLCDTPGIMVGPEAEKTALVRHASRMFVTAASVSVPFFTIVLRKGYGLGAQAMAGGSFKAGVFTVAWPTGEFGGMGLEGAVKLGFRKELAAEEDPEKRRALYDEMVARMYQHGKALNTASTFEIDDVIDPAESRTWVLRALRSAPPPVPRTGKKRPCIDTW
ncbi:MAG: carbamoyl-phosphate synthase large subunit [bacterium]|nr:carbamoyl-phosphate synthase large subunit [bacterium]